VTVWQYVCVNSRGYTSIQIIHWVALPTALLSRLAEARVAAARPSRHRLRREVCLRGARVNHRATGIVASQSGSTADAGPFQYWIVGKGASPVRRRRCDHPTATDSRATMNKLSTKAQPGSCRYTLLSQFTIHIFDQFQPIGCHAMPPSLVRLPWQPRQRWQLPSSA
jgi:hypothetical protein